MAYQVKAWSLKPKPCIPVELDLLDFETSYLVPGLSRVSAIICSTIVVWKEDLTSCFIGNSDRIFQCTSVFVGNKSNPDLTLL